MIMRCHDCAIYQFLGSLTFILISGSKIYCQIVETPMGIACASLLLLLSYGTELQVKLHTELDA